MRNGGIEAQDEDRPWGSSRVMRSREGPESSGHRVTLGAYRNALSQTAKVVAIVGQHEERPWGSYTVLEDQPGHKVKRIVVAPGKRLSYQRHFQRSEHWFVVAGNGRVTVDGAVSDVAPGASVDVAVGVAHRVENCGEAELVFIEVQHGTYFGEDDIVRLQDDYGRVR
jgi:mannose-6-phosphate isomerase